MTDRQDWLHPEEIAAQLQVSTETVLSWLRIGTLEGELGADQVWRVAPAALEAQLRQRAPRAGTALLKRLESSSRPEDSDKTGTDERR